MVLFLFFVFVCFLLFLCLGRVNGLQYARESRCPNLKESVISSFRDSLTLQAIQLKGIRLCLVRYQWSTTSFWFCSVVRWSLEYSLVYQCLYIFHQFLFFVFLCFWFFSFIVVFFNYSSCSNITYTCSPCPGKFSELLKCSINTFLLIISKIIP